jgi:RNA recognition motif-containing protein
MSVRLFVGNLAYDVTESELRELFSAIAAPSYVRLPTDRETGKPRGFAFVEFGDRAQADEAVRRFNQHLFKGRPLAVNEARAREDGPAARSNSPASAAWPGDQTSSADQPARPSQPRRTFGPDAPPRGKRKNESRGAKGERGPKGPMRERTGGQFFGGDVEDAHDEDQGADDFASWAQDEKTKDDDFASSSLDKKAKDDE